MLAVPQNNERRPRLLREVDALARSELATVRSHFESGRELIIHGTLCSRDTIAV